MSCKESAPSMGTQEFAPSNGIHESALGFAFNQHQALEENFHCKYH